MATFNPQIQDQSAPQYQFGSPVQKYGSNAGGLPTTRVNFHQGDSSAGVALKGLGNILAEGLKGADETVKSVIDDAIASGVDKQREGFTGALEQIGGVPQTQRVADYQPDAPSVQTVKSTLGSPTSLLPQGTDVPDAVTAGVGTASSLTNSATSGKIPSTYYWGRLDTLAKDMRSQFPGYRSYIDAKISSMTGGNPANEYMNSLLQNINRAQQGNKSETEKALAIVTQNAGVEGAQTEAHILSQGVADPIAHAVGWIHDWAAVDVKNKRALQEISLFKGNQDIKVAKATELAGGVLDGVFSNTWNETIQGLGKNWDQISKMSADDLQKLVNSSDVNGQQMAQSIQIAENNVRVAMMKRLNEKSPTGETWGQILGPTAVKTLIDSKIAPYTTIADSFANKDYGAAHFNANFTTSKIKDSNAWLLKDSKVADAAAMYTSVNSLLGPAAASWYIARSDTLQNLDDVVQQYTNYQKLKLMTDPNASLSGVIDDMKSKGLGDPNDPTKRGQSAAYQTITNTTKFIADPKIPDAGKVNLIKSSFSAANNDLVSKFADDTVDAKGNIVPGQHTILRDMTTPQITSEIYRLSQTNPQLWTTYKDWVDRSTNTLIRNDVRSLNEIAVNPNLKITWDTDKHQFGIVFSDAFFNTPYSRTGITSNTNVPKALADSYRQRIAKINAAIQPKVNVAAKEGGDVNADMLNYAINGLGLDPRGLDNSSALVRAIVGPTQPETKPPATPGAKPDSASLTAPSGPGSAVNEAVSRFGKAYLPQIPELSDYKTASQDGTTPLHNTVKQAESDGNYDALYGSTSKVPLSNMTVGEVLAVQKHHTDNGSASSAAGAYQFLRGTLQSLIRAGVVSASDPFDKNTQDRLATALMERRGLNDYKTGKISKEQFVNNLAKEWAGLPTTKGQSYYEGDGLNHSRVKLPKVFASLAGL